MRPPNGLREPAPGDYVYDLTGWSTGPTGERLPYPPGATQTVHVDPGTPVAGGTEYQTATISGRDATVQIIVRTRWESARVLLLSTVIQLGGLFTVSCAYSHPPETLHLPPVPETFPQQSFSGDCSGTIDVTVANPENVTAAGRTWRAWRVSSSSTFSMSGLLTGRIEMTNWLAPELGEPVRSETTIEAQIPSVQNQVMSIHQSTLLRSRP